MLLYTLTLAVLVVGALGCVQLPRIFGGDPTTIDKHPYQVSLEGEYEGKFYHYCGGSIISEDWVLTAAHCVSDLSSEEFKVRVGSTYVNERREGDVHTVSHFIVHPEHVPNLRVYDVAVVKVLEPFKFSDNVQPISMVSETPANDSPVVVTGWGRTENNFQPPKQLMQVGLGIMDIDACNQTFSGHIFDSMVCANVPGESKSSCFGDSGGPLVYDGKVAGVVSWGSGYCGYYADPTVFANVALVKDWVSSTTGVN